MSKCNGNMRDHNGGVGGMDVIVDNEANSDISVSDRATNGDGTFQGLSSRYNPMRHSDSSAVVSILNPPKEDVSSVRRRVSYVLEDSKKARKTVTWNTSSNRVDKYNEKAQQRHLELVVARAMRRRALLMARPSGLE
jgi:hypothetical protein